MFPELGAAQLAGVVIAEFLLSFALGVEGMGHLDHFTVNHNIFFFPLPTSPGISPLNVTVSLCHKLLDLNPWQYVPS